MDSRDDSHPKPFFSPLLHSRFSEHLDLLKEFEGVISDEDLVKRKRELFLALPSAPPAASPSKKAKL
jgi:hypothetical protein